MHPATDATRVAVEFLTLWLDPDRTAAAEHIDRVLETPEGPTKDHAVVGLLNLAMLLLLQLAREQGASTYEEITSRARLILAELSIALPETESSRLTAFPIPRQCDQRRGRWRSTARTRTAH
jgi:hypothetical protein